MSINAIRGLILAANLLLIGLIGWAAYNTFYFVDHERWEVIPPDRSKYEPPVVQEDERRYQQQVYKVIGRVFDPRQPEVPVGPVVEDVKPDTRAPLERIEVLSIQFNPRDPSLSSALLKGPQAREPRFFMPGHDLGVESLGWGAYRGAKVKAITEDNRVILVGQDGKEVPLDGPKQSASRNDKSSRENR